jgi:hypothetical protein
MTETGDADVRFGLRISVPVTMMSEGAGSTADASVTPGSIGAVCADAAEEKLAIAITDKADPIPSLRANLLVFMQVSPLLPLHTKSAAECFIQKDDMT